MLTKVKIIPSCTAEECEEAINKAIQDNLGFDVSYEMLIESNVTFGGNSITKYTLLINVENVEGED